MNIRKARIGTCEFFLELICRKPSITGRSVHFQESYRYECEQWQQFPNKCHTKKSREMFPIPNYDIEWANV